MPTPSKTQTKKNTKVNKILKSKKPVLVLFYMIGCSHCDALHPTWKDVVSTYEKNKGIETAEVEFGDLALFPEEIRKNIAGFPTIQVVKDGKVISEYVGGRTKESIEEFANKYVEDTSISKSNTMEGGNKSIEKKTKENKVKEIKVKENKVKVVKTKNLK